MLIRTSIAPPVRGDGSSDAESQQRVISRVEELPMSEKDFHVARRVDSSGTLERQLKMTMPAQISDSDACNNHFELRTPSGLRHEMFFSATVASDDAKLRFCVTITNAVEQIASLIASTD